MQENLERVHDSLDDAATGLGMLGLLKQFFNNRALSLIRGRHRKGKGAAPHTNYILTENAKKIKKWQRRINAKGGYYDLLNATRSKLRTATNPEEIERLQLRIEGIQKSIYLANDQIGRLGGEPVFR